jgi:hypothetical protein
LGNPKVKKRYCRFISAIPTVITSAINVIITVVADITTTSVILATRFLIFSTSSLRVLLTFATFFYLCFYSWAALLSLLFTLARLDVVNHNALRPCFLTI